MLNSEKIVKLGDRIDYQTITSDNLHYIMKLNSLTQAIANLEVLHTGWDSIWFEEHGEKIGDIIKYLKDLK